MVGAARLPPLGSIRAGDHGRRVRDVRGSKVRRQTSSTDSAPPGLEQRRRRGRCRSAPAPSTSSGSSATPWTAAGVALVLASPGTVDCLLDPLSVSGRTQDTGCRTAHRPPRHRFTGAVGPQRWHIKVNATWGIHQRVIAVHHEPHRTRARELMGTLSDSVSQGAPKASRPSAATEMAESGNALAGDPDAPRRNSVASCSRKRPRSSPIGASLSRGASSGLTAALGPARTLTARRAPPETPRCPPR
jgi:hypothetical protein